MFAKIFRFLTFLLLLLRLAPSLGWASSTPPQSSVPHALKIWDREIHYQLLIKNDSALTHDGEAFTKNVKGQKISYVVLNPAFFAKEAMGLFDRLGEKKTSLKSETGEGLTQLEERLLQLSSSTPSSEVLTPSVKDSLKRLQKIFEEIAWRKTYQNSLAKGADLVEAKRIFVQEFTESRMNTIEHHEAAHLYDLEDSSNHESAQFEKYTEINAFYAELVYGDNPHDVMAQAIVGLMDEMGRGKVVDYSIEKVVSVLKFLKTCPRYAKFLESGPLPKCCLEMLAKANHRDFIQVGQTLYRNHQNLFKNTFASL